MAGESSNEEAVEVDVVCGTSSDVSLSRGGYFRAPISWTKANNVSLGLARPLRENTTQKQKDKSLWSNSGERASDTKKMCEYMSVSLN